MSKINYQPKTQKSTVEKFSVPSARYSKSPLKCLATHTARCLLYCFAPPFILFVSWKKNSNFAP